MKLNTRTLVAVLFSLSLLAPAASAQQQQQPAAKPAKGASKKAAAPAEADPLAEARRQTAINLVNSLADEARNFSEPRLRSRAQARAADVLWDTDAERGRTLFRRAWDAAEAADEAEERRLEEERRRQQSERGFFSVRRGPSLRAEVLRLAAKRDRALGEEFLARMDDAKKKSDAALAQPDASQPARRREAQESPPAIEKRLRLAIQLLQDGDTDRAIAFADPALIAVTVHALDFLGRLRPHNTAAADQRYMALLAHAQADPSSDANTVSLLSSYIFTPALFVTFTRDAGSNSSRYGDTVAPPKDIPPPLRAAFFNSAAAVLMRPTPPPEQDQTTSGRAGTYMVITRLLPLFDQFAPDKATALRTKLAALTPDTPERARQPGNSSLTAGLVPEDPNRDRTQEMMSRLDRAKDQGERDAIYSEAAQDAARRKDLARADEYVGKIEDNDVRRQVRAFVDFEMLDDAVRDKDAAEALRLAREGEFEPLHRVWGLTEAARLLTKDQPGRAVEALEMATEEARKIDAGTSDRVRALVAIVTRYAELDRPRAWEMLAEVVKASNAAQDFTGEDASLNIVLRTKTGVTSRSSSADTLDLSGLFVALARDNFEQAVELVRGFKAEHPRTAATLAIARAVLDRKADRASR
jgi:hypothetical protein